MLLFRLFFCWYFLDDLEFDGLDPVPAEVDLAEAFVVDVNLAGDVVGHAADVILVSVLHVNDCFSVAPGLDFFDVAEAADEPPAASPIVVDGETPLLEEREPFF